MTTMESDNARPATRPSRLRLPAALVSIFFLASLASGGRAPQPGRMEAALACLLSQRGASEVLRDLGLRLGQAAPVRYFIGNIAGLEPAPGEYSIIIYSRDRSRAWLLAAEPARDGRFIPEEDAFQMRRTEGHWVVEEGFGGLATYRAVGRFATWLSQHRPEYRVILRASPGRCSPHQ